MEGFWLVSYIAVWLLLLFLLACVFVLLRQVGQIYLGTSPGVWRDGLKPGTQGPSFTAFDMSGREFTMPQVASKWLFMIFGRAVCPPCQALVPTLNSISGELKNEVDFVFLSQSDLDTSKVFALESGIGVPVLAVPDEKVGQRYKTRVTPFAFVLDEDGVVRAKGLVNDRDHIQLLLANAREHRMTNPPSRVDERARPAAKDAATQKESSSHE